MTHQNQQDHINRSSAPPPPQGAPISMADLERLLATMQPAPATNQGGAGHAVDLSSAVEGFILDQRAGGNSPATVRWYKSLLSAFVAAHEGARLDAITGDQCRRYLADLRERHAYKGASQRPEQPGTVSKSTVAGHDTALRAFWHWAAKEYRIDNPMANVKRSRQPAPAPKAVESADFVRLFDGTGNDEAGDRNRALLAFLADTGVRVSGLCGLKRDKLLLPEHQALVSEKGDKTRIVVFTKYTRALLALWLDRRTLGSDFVFTSLTTGEPLTPSGVDQLLRRLKKETGVRGRVNPHAFRHAFAREYLKAGGDAIRLAKLIGHGNVNTTAAYYAVFTPDELAQMHEDYSPLRRMMEAR